MNFPTMIALALEDIDADNPQEILGARIGVTQGTISKWVNAGRLPHQRTWKTIASAIDRDLNEISEAIGNTTLADRESVTDQLANCRQDLALAREEIQRLEEMLRAAR